MSSIRFASFSRPLALLIVLNLFVGSACSSGDGPYFGKVQPPEGQVLRYITGSEPQTLDPHIITSQSDSRIAGALFDGLVDYEEITMGQRPSLAKSWKANSDGTVWTFYLRTDARWTDNTPLNAHDFVYSWRRAVSPELGASYATTMFMVKNARPYNAKEAFVRDPSSRKLATVGDLQRSRGQQTIAFTGNEPERFDTAPPNQPDKIETQIRNSPPAKVAETVATSLRTEDYLFIPVVNALRDKKLKADPELARFIEGKELVPVQKEHMGVRALDDFTFQVTLEEPKAYFIKLLNHQFFRPVPRKAIETHGDAHWFQPGNIVTSGAFKLEEWRPYERIVVVRNSLFWDNANTRLDKIIFPAIHQLTTAMNLYKAGEVDATQSNEIPPAWRRYLKETKRDYMTGPYLQVEALAIKVTLPVLNDVRVRQAISMAINRQILADQAPGRLPTTSFVPIMDGYENAKVEGYNPDKARQLLREAGFTNGQGFPDFEILFNSNESNKQTQELIQQMLKNELGIRVQLTNKENQVYLEDTRATSLKYRGFARWGWQGDYVDPYAFLELLGSMNPNNRSGWKDLKYDSMLEAANREPDQPKRMKLLHEAEEYMMSQQPLIPLFIGPSSFLKKPYVKNLVPNLLDQHDWRGVYIDHAATARNGFTDPVGQWSQRLFAFQKY